MPLVGARTRGTHGLRVSHGWGRFFPSESTNWWPVVDRAVSLRPTLDVSSKTAGDLVSLVAT